MDIALPFIILGIMAMIFGVILAIAAKKLAVLNDDKVDRVLELLTGANCGACGYAGCEAFAKALVDGKTDVSECPSTAANKENSTKISELLGSEMTDIEKTKVVCACNGGNRCLDKYEYQGYGDCLSIEILAGGRKACDSGCIGAGKCVDGCAYNAINMLGDGVATISQEKCIQCGFCIKICPKKVMKRISGDAKIYIACSSCEKGKGVRNMCSVGCIGCGLCARVCESGAIEMRDNLPVINYKKCTNCKKCVEKCPAKCILNLD